MSRLSVVVCFVYFWQNSGVIVHELWVICSRNSDISTKSFFPNLWWRHNESPVAAPLLLSFHVVASKLKRKWKGKFILFPFLLLFLTSSLYIARPTDPDLCYLSLNSFSLWKSPVWVQAPWPTVWLGRGDCLDSSQGLMFLPCHTLHIYSLRSLE